MRSYLVTVLAVLALSGPVAAQAIKDPAEAMPARVLGYAEMRQPGAFVKELVGLFENSALGNVPESMFKFLEEMKVPPPRRGLGELGAAGLFFSPEVVREAQRLQGAGVALTGLGEKGNPEFIAVALPGESNAPRLLFRALLTMERLKPSGTVEGVTVYQPYRLRDDKPVEDRSVALAMMPDALLIGSPGEVKAAIARIKGGKKDTLAASATFVEARKAAGDKPGPFAYLNIADAMDIVGKLPHLGQQEKDVLEAIGKAYGLKAFRAQVYSLSLDKGTLNYREVVLLDPKEKSLILDVLPSRAVPRELFHFTPNDGVAALAISNDNGEKRYKMLVDFADQVAKLSGGNEVPSEHLDKLQKALGIDLGKDVLGRIAALGVALGDPMKAPIKRVEEKGQGFESVMVYPELPAVLTIQASDEESAGKLIEDVLPKFHGAILRKEAKPTTKDVLGQKVHTLAINKFASLNYGRQGKTIVIGPYPTPVAQALNNGAKKQGLATDAKVAAGLKEIEGAIVLGVARPLTLLRGMLGAVFMHGVSSKQEKAAPPKDEKQPEPQERRREQARVEKPEENPMLKEFNRLLEDEGLLTFSVTRQKDRLLEDITLTKLKPAAGKLVDFGLKMWLPSESIAPPRPDGPRGDVQGKVNFQGRPLPGGSVVFLNERGISFSTAIAEDGTYSLRNVPAGAAKVIIIVPEPRKDDKPGRRLIRIPAKYSKPETSGLRYDIQPDKQTFDIELK